MFKWIITILKIVGILKKSICIACKHYTKIVVAGCSITTKNYGDYVDNYQINIVACKDVNPNGNCKKFKKIIKVI